MAFLVYFIQTLVTVLTLAIIIRAIMSWFSPSSTNIIAVILLRITEPLLAPLRRIIPIAGPFDFSPLVAIIIIQLIGQLIITILINYL